MPRKRGVRGRGTVYERPDGSGWIGQISYGSDDTGKRLRYAVTGESAKAVDQKLRKLLGDLEQDRLIAPARGTIAGFLEAWLGDAALRVRESTHREYKRVIERHVIPKIGTLVLRKVDRNAFVDFFARLRDEKFTPHQLRAVYKVLHTAFAEAVKRDRISRNPLEGIPVPTYRAREMQPLTLEQSRALLREVRGDPLEALYILALFTGMRQGEIFGLTWRDVDLRSGSIAIRNSLMYLDGAERRLAPAKTAGSRRRVELPKIAVDALRAHEPVAKLRNSATGGFVFTNGAGEPLDRSVFLRREWYPLLKRAKLPRIRFHDLRHTMATLMLQAGEHPKVVAERLGHSQVATTLDVYSHVSPTMQRAAADRLESAVLRRPGRRKGNKIGNRPTRRKAS